MTLTLIAIILSVLEFVFFRNSRFPIRSVFVINVSLFASVVCYCQNWLWRKHGKCLLCNDWWHSIESSCIIV